MELILEQGVFGYGQTAEPAFCLGPVDLCLRPGELTVILGPNGSGKSTLLGLLSGRLKLREGRLELRTAEGPRMPLPSGPKRSEIMGLLPQTGGRHFDYTVEEMAAMGAYARRGLLSPESPAEKARRREVLERLGLGELKNRGVLSLSGGEYQKVLLSRLLIQDPLIFLLDEPANHLDLEHQLFIFSLVKEECRKGRAAAAVLHDINLALSYADKLLALDRGKPVYQGPPEAAALREVLEKLYHLPLAEYTGPEGRRLLWPFL